MMEILSILGTLIMLILLQVVLGFDNLLYIAIESKKAPLEKQSMVRKLGIGIAIFFRLLLLLFLIKLIEKFENPFIIYDSDILSLNMNLESLIIILGGIFILYTSVKEIWHMLHFEENITEQKNKSVTQTIVMIVIMNLVFSFDSILSAMALTENNYIIAIAIIIGGILMIIAANKVSAFLQKNRMYEVLGLFILFLVGVMLISDGGHMAEMKIFKQEISAMNKSTFYFILIILVLIDIVQTKYQKNLLKRQNQS
ncbi:MAG: tellurium resistance protein TerC [Crocinitomicaceae bacterium]|nr:tellurium resistance protein TerC [Crocinitomicaceae bacterium]